MINLEEIVLAVLLDLGQNVTTVKELPVQLRATYQREYSLQIYPDRNSVVIESYDREVGRISYDRYRKIYANWERYNNSLRRVYD